MFRAMPASANPILSTVETIKGYPSVLKLFKCAESRYWQVSVYLDSRSIRKSTKTVEKASAVRFAKQFYNNLLLKQAQNLPLSQSPLFNIVAEALFEEDQAKVDRGERAKSLVSDNRYIYEADLLKFFHNSNIKDITYKRLTDYIKHLKTRGKKPVGSKTIKNHFILINKILKHANKLGYIDKLPVFPTITAKDNPREWLNNNQYTSLLAETDKAIKEQVKVRFIPITIHLRYLIEFVTNSFLRPPDIKTLKHRQIALVTGKAGEYLRIMAYSKVKPAPVVTMPAAAVIYKLIGGDPDSYVFFPEYKNRDYAMSTMNRQFNYVLNAAGLKEGPNGAHRTLYSLRHTAIMNTLLRAKNVNLLTLARNCRTSVEMLERFYAAQLTAEMNVHQLHDQSEEQAIYTVFDEYLKS
jgi:hypothetical protein